MEAPASNKKYLVLLFLVIFPLYLTWTFDHSLWNPDETRDAGIAREMFVSGDFVTPHLNGVAFLEKPPLYYWTCSAIYAVTGRITAGLTRLPAGLYGFLGVLFTFLIGKRLFGMRAGFIAAAILATASQYFRMSHFALMDTSLAALITGALYFYVAGNAALFAVFVVLAFYTKGFVAVALAGVVIGTDLILKKNFRRLGVITLVGIGIFVISVTPWVYSLWKAGGADYLRVFFIDNNFHRFASGKTDHYAPFYFYLGSFPADFLPWTFLLIAALIRRPGMLIGRGPGVLRDEPGPRLKDCRGDDIFLKVWLFSIFIFLSLSSSKRSMYILPAFPAAALLCGAWLDRLIDEGGANKWETGAFRLTIGLLGLVLIAVFGGHFYTHRSFPALLIGLAVTALFMASLVFSLRRKFYWNVFIGLFYGICFALISANSLFIEDMEADKSFLPFIAEVKRTAEGSDVVAYDMSEMERGVFPFYFEKLITNFTTIEALDAFLNAHSSQRILIIANRNKFAALDPLLKTKADVAAAFRPDKKTRSYMLYVIPARR